MSMRIDLIVITAQNAHKITRCERMPTRMGSDHYGVMMRVDTHKPDLCLEEAMHAGVADIEKRAVTDGIMDDIRRADTAASVRGAGDEQPRIERKPCVVITTGRDRGANRHGGWPNPSDRTNTRSSLA